jgi:hypothetical protein
MWRNAETTANTLFLYETALVRFTKAYRQCKHNYKSNDPLLYDRFTIILCLADDIYLPLKA